MKNGIFRALTLALFFLCALLVSGEGHTQATVEYIHTDALGTPVAVTNATGVVIERSEYEPYGQLVNRPLTDGPGFTGHVQDAATGLTYMQQRYYDPVIGRFLSVDPVTPYNNPVVYFNRYRYAVNNPYKFTDPDGRSIWTKLAKFLVKGGDIAQTTAGLVEDFETASDSSNSFPTRLAATTSMASEILPLSVGDIKDGAKAVGKAADVVGDAFKKSPDIDPKDIAGRTPAEIDGIAKQSGLLPKGPDPSSGKGAYVDPVTGNQRVLVHPGADCGPHCHVNNAAGERLDINGNKVPPESPEAHLPLRLE